MPASLPIQKNFSLASLNTFGLDVKASHYLAVDSLDMLSRLFHAKEWLSLPRLILGGGSNIVFKGDFPGLVLHVCIKGKNRLQTDEADVFIQAGAGENWHEFVCWTLENGWGGLENLSLIPGTVGAAPVQNIGAYGSEFRDFCHSLKAFDFESGQLRTFSKDDCAFSYRDSYFKQQGQSRYLVVEVTFRLPGEWTPNLAYAEVHSYFAEKQNPTPCANEIAACICEIRQRKLPDPKVNGNAGSFFKNPALTESQLNALRSAHPDMPAYLQPSGHYRVAAGWLIDRCGWKGKMHGGAKVCPTQALVLMNDGSARGKDVLALAEKIRADVHARFGIMLEPEPLIV